ncbi:MAG: outer membrane beta-barrel protein [Pyrinomonadaceae bacterium]|nr:outer membrane beta-barrel protein [Sphingobacteriaceae bacterium]
MRKSILLISFLVLLKFSSFAQGNWGGGADDQIFSPGFTFQYLSSEYKIYKRPDWRKRFFDIETNRFVTDSLQSIKSPTSQGFGLGFIANFKINDHTDLRITPTLVFLARTLSYEYHDPTQNRLVEIPTTTAEFPIGIKLKSDRRLNFRAYILAGGKYSHDIVSKKKTTNEGKALTEMLVTNRKGYLSYDVGVGFDFYFEFFKLTPELKLSNSIGNVLKYENHPYTSPLEKAYTRNFQFSLFFE